MRIAEILHDSIVDGPGLRVVVFFQGCRHNCKGCHNPALLDQEGGSVWSPDEVLAEIRKNPLAAGVTFSGGEPLDQAAEIIPLAKRLSKLGYDLWLYTGERVENLSDIQLELLKLCNTVVDGPYDETKRSPMLPWQGSENQRVIDVKNYFKNMPK